MIVKIPATLTAEVEEAYEVERYEVVVKFAHLEIARLPARGVWYGMDADDLDVVAAETVAPYLARIFSTEA